jgi:Bacterial SH3 domain
MTDSGLSTRLRQQSRRAGLMVGISMVLTIAICIFGAAGLFAWLSRPFSDLIPVSAPAAEAPVSRPTSTGAEAQPTVAPTIAAQTVASEDNPTAPTPAATSEAFTPTHQIRSDVSVNFRGGPSTNDSIIIALSPATPLQYLGEEAPTSNPSDGDRWMKFRNESGQEGWVREIDTEPYEP